MEKSEKTASTCFRDLVPFCLWYDVDPTLPLGYFEKPGSWPATFSVLWIWGWMLGLGNMRMRMSMKIRVRPCISTRELRAWLRAVQVVPEAVARN